MHSEESRGTMPSSKPNDRTTPPSTPRTTTNSQAPRISAPVSRTVPRYIDPCDGRPAVWPHDAFPRGYGTQDGLHDAFTWEQAEYVYYTRLIAAIAARNQYCYYRPRLPSDSQTKPSQQHSQRPHQQQQIPAVRPNLMQERLSRQRATALLMRPMPIPPPRHKMTRPAMRDMSSPPMARPVSQTPTEAASSSSPAKTKPILKINMPTKPTGWASTMRKKRRPSEIFNMNFSFSAPSRRSLSDRTPEISPRSSFSAASFSEAATSSLSSSIEEPAKRQRIDSSGPDALLGFPFGKPVPESSTRGRDLGSYPSSPAPGASSSSSSVRSSFQASKLSSSRLAFPAVEVHPGQLVDFSTPRYEARPRPIERHSMSSRSKLFLSSSVEARQREDFGTPASSRRSSSPAKYQSARQSLDESAILGRAQILDGKSAESSSASTSVASSRKRACTLERKDRVTVSSISQSTYSHTPSLSSASSNPSTPASSLPTPGTSVSLMPKQEPGSLRRTTSDPSAEACLKHIRASLERRRSTMAAFKWQEYPVFADEAERGFLLDDDEPL